MGVLLVRAFVQHATTVILAVLAIFVFGTVSYISLPRESAPDVEIPFVVVSTPYVGVSPADIEGLVTIPIENELASLTGVKSMKSTSAEGISVVSLEFEPEVDIDEALQKARDRVNRAKSKLPDDAEEPSVSEVSFSDIPVLLVTIAGDLDEQALKSLAEDLEDDVLRVEGVLDAEVTGGREREIQVQVEPHRLAHYGLSLNDVVQAIQGENVNIPGGDVTVGDATFLLRTPGEFTDARQLEEVAIKRVGDRPVFLTDVARIHDGFEDRETYSRMNGQPAVTLSVKKRTGSNILEVAEGIKAEAARHANRWPEGVSHQILADQSEDIEGMVAELQNNIITALLLVVGVLFVFMGARNSLFVAVAIPLSMLGSMAVLDMLDFTLNMVVLFSLILALGMLVDNAIVVVENVYRHAEEGKSLFQAAIDGTNEVAIAVAASTATTVAAFFPMVFWSGIMGQFMGYLPKTVIIVLVSSLVVAILILPVLTSRLMTLPKARKGEEGDAAPEPVDDAAPVDRDELSTVMGRYFDLLTWSIRHRYASLGLGIATLVVSLGIYAVFNHGMEFFPAVEPDRAVVSVQLPEGADLEATDKVVRMVEGILADTDNVDVFVAEVGVAASGNALQGSSNQANAARVTVDFLPTPDRAEAGETLRVESTELTMVKLRHAVQRIPGAEITVEPEEFGPPVGDKISIEVSGDDFHEVGTAAQALMREIAKIEGSTDLKTDYRVGRPELRLRIDRGAAKRVGVSSSAVGNAVRTAIAGTKASALRDGEEEYDIIVSVAPEERSDLQEVLALRVPGREDTSPGTFPVPLSAVADYELAGGSGAIAHVDQDLVVTITGDVTDPSLETAVQAEIRSFLETWEAPAGISTRLGGSTDEQAEAAAFLSWAFAVAVALILMVLVTQFDSLAMPAIILFTVVLSLVGVLWGLLLTGKPFGLIMTGIGVISLAGVVVNNAIVLLDYVEQLRKRGMAMQDALLRAGVTRFRPVMLTAVTTALGLIPMALGISIDFFTGEVIFGSSSAQFWGSMAVAVIFGLSFATILTLVMVPTLYSIYEDMLAWGARLRGKGMKGAAGAASVLLVVAVGLAVPGSAQAVTLEEAIRAAESDNLDLQLAREQAVQAGTFQWQALSAVMPRITAGAGFVINQEAQCFQQDPENGLVPDGNECPEIELDLGGFPLPDGFDSFTDNALLLPKTAWDFNVTLYQPVLNGQAFPAWQAAKRQGSAAAADARRAAQQVHKGVAQVFYGLATARQALEVSEASVVLAQHQLDLAQRQVDAGLADRRAVLQAELGLSRAERDLLGAEERVVEAAEAFTQTTGLPRDVPLEMPDAVDVPQDLDAAVERARTARPDVAAATYRREAASLERTARDLEWLPSVALTFTESYTQFPGFIDRQWLWRFGLDFQWNIFDGGLRIARSRELKSQVRSAQLMIDKTRQEAESEVRTSWQRLERAERALAAVQDEIALAQESLTLAERGFQAGSATWLEVEQARISLEGARLSLLTERMNRDLAATDVLLAVGDL